MQDVRSDCPTELSWHSAFCPTRSDFDSTVHPHALKCRAAGLSPMLVEWLVSDLGARWSNNSATTSPRECEVEGELGSPQTPQTRDVSTNCEEIVMVTESGIRNETTLAINGDLLKDVDFDEPLSQQVRTALPFWAGASASNLYQINSSESCYRSSIKAPLHVGRIKVFHYQQYTLTERRFALTYTMHKPRTRVRLRPPPCPSPMLPRDPVLTRTGSLGILSRKMNFSCDVGVLIPLERQLETQEHAPSFHNRDQ